MKGHEYILKHYLGTSTNAVADEIVSSSIKEVHCEGPRRKENSILWLI